MKKNIQQIFSIENEGIYKKITILGLKIKFTNKVAKTLNSMKNEELITREYVLNCVTQKTFFGLSVYNLHSKTFPQFKNINNGKDVVIVGCGPTLNNYIPIKDAVHIGLNRAYQKNNIKLDYLFWIDARQNAKACFEELINYDFIKFFGMNCHSECNLGANIFREQESTQIPVYLAEKNKAYRFYSNFPRDDIYFDIETMPLMNFGSIAFPALHFALHTHPNRIYLVGCDCSNAGHYNSQKQIPWDLPRIINGYKEFKLFAQIHYPDVEIISINPIGLAGLFKDEYQNITSNSNNTKEILRLNDIEDISIAGSKNATVESLHNQRKK